MKRTGVFVGLAAFAVGLGTAGVATPAFALSLCARKGVSGEVRDGAPVRLRTTCKAREVALPISIESDLVQVHGANLQDVDGSGGTDGPTNGLGNLIVGYNEDESGLPRTGSHNIIGGTDNGYASYGGIVTG